MSKIVKQEDGLVKYNQSTNQNNTSETKGTGKTTSGGQTDSVGSQNSTSKAEQNGENNREQITNTVRDLSSKSTTSRASFQKANIAFQISFTVPVLGRVPDNQNSNC